MNTTNDSVISGFEWIVLIMVFLATATLGLEPEPEPEPELEVTHLSGKIPLSSRASMDALGFDDYDMGAEAIVEMDAQAVISEGCTVCAETPIGIQLDGTLDIEKLEGGPITRVDGTLSITHLREFLKEDFIVREWISIDWNASGKDLDSHWEISILHDPPKWIVDNRYRAAFITVDEGDESRTGPWIFVETMLDHALNVRGCLPGYHVFCDGSTPHNFNLTSTLEPVKAPAMIQHPTAWVQVESVPSSNGTPVKMVGVRQLLNLEETTDNHTPMCLGNNEEIITTRSWKASSSTGSVIAPMSTSLVALGLPSSSFSVSEGTWIETDTNARGCGALVDNQGVLRLGISIN